MIVDEFLFFSSLSLYLTCFFHTSNEAIKRSHPKEIVVLLIYSVRH